MKGNFVYHNPTKLYFGEDAMNHLSNELKSYGPTVMLSYGGGSIKRNGIYDAVIAALKSAGKTIVEDAGVMPNPTYEKVLEGCRLVRDHKVDLILAVGGGSTIDYAKGVSASAYCEEDAWEKYWVNQGWPTCRTVPVGAVLTMVGTGSEMNGGSVITNRKAGFKLGKVFGPELYPKFTILNPRFTMTVPQYQMVAGFFDIMSHLMEQYFAGTADCTTDYINEVLSHDNINLPVHFFKTHEEFMSENLCYVNDMAVQLEEFNNMEGYLRDRFKQRALKSVRTTLQEDWSSIVKSVAGYDANDERSVSAAETQIRALEMFAKKRLCVLTGAAGTGKTSVVEAFLKSQQIQSTRKR